VTLLYLFFFSKGSAAYAHGAELIFKSTVDRRVNGYLDWRPNVVVQVTFNSPTKRRHYFSIQASFKVSKKKLKLAIPHRRARTYGIQICNKVSDFNHIQKLPQTTSVEDDNL
jgi:hypothetical protein